MLEYEKELSDRFCHVICFGVISAEVVHKMDCVIDCHAKSDGPDNIWKPKYKFKVDASIRNPCTTPERDLHRQGGHNGLKVFPIMATSSNKAVFEPANTDISQYPPCCESVRGVDKSTLSVL